MMSPDQLLKKTSARFPLFEKASFFPIYEGGSDRQFYRCKNEQGDSLIVIHYNGEKAENTLYAIHALFLKSQGLHVPEVMAHAPEECLLWLQDLGEKNLWSMRKQAWEMRRPFYEQTLREAARLHRISPQHAIREGLSLQPPFDKDLYLWEQRYFLDHALGSLFKVNQKTRDSLANSTGFQVLSTNLAKLPQQLIHRDLQSQNILLFQEKVWLIDFQGMRSGLAQYDLASLLCDPYVTLTNSEQKELLDFYQQEMTHHRVLLAPNFEKVFWQCAVQRLMQALGAYGFLGLHQKKSHFLHHVPSALKGLRNALAYLPPEEGLDELAALLSSLHP